MLLQNSSVLEDARWLFYHVAGGSRSNQAVRLNPGTTWCLVSLMMGDINLRVGGAAGDGVASMGEVFARACVRSGMHVAAFNSYQSVIRGGHVWYHVRAAAEKVACEGDRIDLLIALDPGTVAIHSTHLAPGSGVIIDASPVSPPVPEGVQRLEVPLTSLAEGVGGSRILRNTVALGAAAWLLGVEMEPLEGVLADAFAGKGEETIRKNVDAARAGHEHVRKEHVPLRGVKVSGSGPEYLLTGNQAIAIGAAAAGCRFLAQYPMTPASGILHWMSSHSEEYGVVVKQAEDELAAINMAIGASVAGARAMTATSGGGLSLMVEALGLAGMIETPLVVVDSQRSGPSTGMPTKSEQGDLDLVLGAGQGEFPRAVLAPRNVEEAYYLTARAFDLADRYQVPVVILSDFYLSEHYESLEDIDLEVGVDRGEVASSREGEPFRRYAWSENGVSPRAFPGTPGLMFVAGSDEHDESGDLISDVRAGLPASIQIRKRMVEKRMRKLDALRGEMEPPERWGESRPDLTLIGWGSTQGAIREAASVLTSEGIRTATLEFSHLYPLPVEGVRNALDDTPGIVVEANYTGQFAALLRRETGFVPEHLCLRYDGEVITPGFIVDRVHEVMG